MAQSNDPIRPKAKPTAAADNPAPPAQHVWLAGLGAMAKAQEQGSKAIEALVNDGLAFQRKSQAEAQQRLQEATERLSHMASDFGQTTTGRVDKLEHLFEDRVAKALHRLGMPSLLDIQILTDRVAQLEAQMASLAPLPLKSKAKVNASAAAKPAKAQSSGTVAETNRSKVSSKAGSKTKASAQSKAPAASKARHKSA